MTANLLRGAWTSLDSHELRLLLDIRIGGPGQYDGISSNANRIYLPLAGSACRLALTYSDDIIVSVEAGPAFDSDQWEVVAKEIEESILTGPTKVGREYSFSSFRVGGSWRGNRSGIQILPPPDHAPRAPVEMAEHPFILEFPLRVTKEWRITNHRRIRDHRNLTLLLNVLLVGHTSLPPRQPAHFWADVPREPDRFNLNWLRRIFRVTPRDNYRSEIKWVQAFFFAKLGAAVIEELSPSSREELQEVDAEEYYDRVGHDGEGLRIPTDLDDAILAYQLLSRENRAKFGRAMFWMDLASRYWSTSASSSFAALVSAIESLTERGVTHQVYCDSCKGDSQHDSPGATEKFRLFFETYAPGTAVRKRRSEMYRLRSEILHGSRLMQLDEGRAFGWDPPWWRQRELHEDLWGLTRKAMRNWLTSPSTA